MTLPPLRPYQQMVARAVRDSVQAGAGRTFSVMVARQGGKNELSAQLEMILLHANAHQDRDAVKCAPTFVPKAKLSLRRLWSRLPTSSNTTSTPTPSSVKVESCFSNVLSTARRTRRGPMLWQ